MAGTATGAVVSWAGAVVDTDDGDPGATVPSMHMQFPMNAGKMGHRVELTYPSVPSSCRFAQVMPCPNPGGVTTASGAVTTLPVPQTEHGGKPGLGGRDGV